MSLASRIVSDPYQKLTKDFVVPAKTRRFLSEKEDADLGLLQAAYLQEQPYKAPVGSLFERAQAGDRDALEALVEEHTGIVHYWIGKMRPLINHYSCEADAMSSGFHGLMLAIYGYDPAKGKFSYYAFPTVRWLVVRAIQKARTARQPGRAINNTQQMPALCSLYKNNGEVHDIEYDDSSERNYTQSKLMVSSLRKIAKEVADECGDQRIVEVYDMKAKGMSQEEIGAVFGLTRQMVSFLEKRLMQGLKKRLDVATA